MILSLYLLHYALRNLYPFMPASSLYHVLMFMYWSEKLCRWYGCRFLPTSVSILVIGGFLLSSRLLVNLAGLKPKLSGQPQRNLKQRHPGKLVTMLSERAPLTGSLRIR